MVDVFISYKRGERTYADRIAKKLKLLGLSVWYDDNVASGTTFDTEIEAAIRKAKTILVIWSPAAVASDWVRNEASLGKERGNLVALMSAPCELPIAFRSIQFEPLFEPHFTDTHPSWIKTVERIKDLTSLRAEVEVNQGKLRRRRKRNRTLIWLAAWPGVFALFLIGVTLPLALVSRTEIRASDGHFYADYWNDGYVNTAGTWELEGGALASPINQVEIRCDRERGTCLEAKAEIIRWTGSFRSLSVTVAERPIEEWSDSVIVTRNASECFEYVMTINRETETVTALQVRPQDIRERPTCQIANVDVSELEARSEYRLFNGPERAFQRDITGDRWLPPTLMAVLLAWTVFVFGRIIFLWRSKN